MNQTAVRHLTRGPDEPTVPDYEGDQPQDQGSEQDQPRRRPILRDKTPVCSRSGFVGESAWLRAVTHAALSRHKVARTAVTGCGESGA